MIEQNGHQATDVATESPPQPKKKERPRMLFSRHILENLGVQTVRDAAPEDTGAGLATRAAHEALAAADLTAADLDLIASISCTIPDVDVWSMPAKITGCRW